MLHDVSQALEQRGVTVASSVNCDAESEPGSALARSTPAGSQALHSFLLYPFNLLLEWSSTLRMTFQKVSSKKRWSSIFDNFKNFRITPIFASQEVSIFIWNEN